MSERRFKPGDKALIANYPHAESVGRAITVEYSDAPGTVGLIKADHSWYLYEDQLIPWAGEAERRLARDRETIAAKYRETDPRWVKPDPGAVAAVLATHAGDPIALAEEILRLRAQLDALRSESGS